MKWPLQDTYIGILTITLWHFLHYRYKPYLATPCETLHFALIHQPSIKRFGWKPCIKKNVQKQIVNLIRIDFFMKNQVYFRITFWNFLSCETLYFALIPEPLTKHFGMLKVMYH